MSSLLLLLLLILIVLTIQARRRSNEANKRTLELILRLKKVETDLLDAADSESFVEPSAVPKPRLNLEQFLGVKLFAWAAGLALFLGVAFFLKWSFDQGIVTPPVRVAMGIVFCACALDLSCGPRTTAPVR